MQDGFQALLGRLSFQLAPSRSISLSSLRTLAVLRFGLSERRAHQLGFGNIEIWDLQSSEHSTLLREGKENCHFGNLRVPTSPQNSYASLIFYGEFIIGRTDWKVLGIQIISFKN